MKNSSTLHIGLDVHKENIAVAFSAPGDKPQWLGFFGNRQCDIDRFIRTLQSKGKTLAFAYEAGSLPGSGCILPSAPSREMRRFTITAKSGRTTSPRFRIYDCTGFRSAIRIESGLAFWGSS